jgi:hypothetical protein
VVGQHLYCGLNPHFSAAAWDGRTDPFIATSLQDQRVFDEYVLTTLCHGRC